MYNRDFNTNDNFDLKQNINKQQHSSFLKETVERLIQKQQYEKQVFKLWSDGVKKTGICDYFPLEEYLRHIHAIAQAPEGTLLFPEEITVLVDNIEQATKKIIDCAEGIKQIINCLKTHFNESLENDISSELNHKLRILGKTLQYIFSICAKYNLIDRDFSTFSYKPDPSTEYQTEIERMVWDLNYYLQYCQEVIQSNKLYLELPLIDNVHMYFDRLFKYLKAITEKAGKLAELLLEDLDSRDVTQKLSSVFDE